MKGESIYLITVSGCALPLKVAGVASLPACFTFSWAPYKPPRTSGPRSGEGSNHLHRRCLQTGQNSHPGAVAGADRRGRSETRRQRPPPSLGHSNSWCLGS